MNELLIVSVLSALPAALRNKLLWFLTKVCKQAAAAPDLQRRLRNMRGQRDQYKRNLDECEQRMTALRTECDDRLASRQQLSEDYKRQWDELHALKADGPSARTLLTLMQTNPQLRVGLDAITLQACVRNNWQVIATIKELRTLFSHEGRTYFPLMNAKDIVEVCREQHKPEGQA